ncbi:MAG TPA: NAD(P)-dependent oxidoreductase [Ktedonobacterales bacterium]|nr:NAD(P)-dependent oxidoreductase [Ktedonobacterales bacterium]
MADIICLRPAEDFTRVGASIPTEWDIAFRKPADADVPDLLGGARAVVLPSAGPHLPGELFRTAHGLQLIQYTGAGWDRIAEPIVRELGCPVANVPGVNAKDVAEYVVIAAGMLLRRFKLGDRLMWGGEFDLARGELAAERARGFTDLTIGVVGLGHIGLAVGKAFRAFDARVLYYDPKPLDPEAASAAGIIPAAMSDLLDAADVVSVHVPLLPATVGMLGEAELARLKPEAIVVQASRGGVVNEEVLLRLVESGRIAGAALDVFAREPLPPDDPILLKRAALFDRILLTPHIAGVTRQAAVRLYEAAWANVARVLKDRLPPTNRVL